MSGVVVGIVVTPYAIPSPSEVQVWKDPWRIVHQCLNLLTYVCCPRNPKMIIQNGTIIKMSTMKKLLVVILAVVVFSAWFGWRTWTQSPAYTLVGVLGSVKNRDFPSFERFIDVEAMVTNMVDDAQKKLEKETTGKPKAALEALGAGVANMMKPALAKAATENLRKAVENHPEGSVSIPSPLQMTWASITKSGPIFFDSMKVDGKVAKATIKAGPPLVPAPVSAKLTMREKDGHWQIFASDDYQELGRFLEVLDKAKHLKPGS